MTSSETPEREMHLMEQDSPEFQLSFVEWFAARVKEQPELENCDGGFVWAKGTDKNGTPVGGAAFFKLDARTLRAVAQYALDLADAVERLEAANTH